jgi:adenylyltransferase/sulfurtransferase
MVETCDTSGILNPAVNLAASLEATEAIKWIVGAHDRMRHTLFSCDVWTNEISEIDASHPRSHCTVCGQHQFSHLAGVGRPQITLCGRNSVQIHEHDRPIDFAELERKLQPHGTVRRNDMLLRFDRGEHRIIVFSDGRAIVQGTTDAGLARSLYSRFVGS